VVLVMKIGIISDTHGRLSGKVLELFSGVEAIFHAGDIGSPKVIDALEELAPVYAVRGNMDYGPLATRFPRKEFVELDDLFFHIIHEPHLLDIDPAAAGIDCVIFGHTHEPYCKEKDGVLFINPGSASLPRYGQSPSVACCTIDGKIITPKIYPL